MKGTIQSDLIRGNINTIILKTLSEGDRYGYDIIKEIEQKSSGQYKLKAPTLYSCLKRLEIQGFITAYWGAKTVGGRRKYYTLTEMGKELFIQSQNEWEYSRTIIDKLISDKTVQLEQSDSAPVVIEYESEDEYIKALNDALYDEKSPGELALEDEDFIKQEADAQQNGAANDEIIFKNEEKLFDNSIVTNEQPTAAIKQEVEFIDANKLLDDLFNRERGEQSSSYAIKVKNEKIEEVKQQKFSTTTASQNVEYAPSGDYFQDFYDENEEISYEQLLKQEQAAIKKEPSFLKDEQDTHLGDAFTPQNSSSMQEQLPFNSIEQDEHTKQAKAEDATKKDTPADAAQKNQFLNYHEPFTSPDSNKSEKLLEREYKNILARFAEQSFTTTTPKAVKPSSKELKEVAATEAAEIECSPSQEEVPSISLIETREANKKLNKIAQDAREMGNDVKIRTHSTQISKEYSTNFYYYSNKLMLTHYAILFGIMLAEILLCCVTIYLGLHIKRQGDISYYIAATLVALLFPTFAFIKCFAEPNKRKRINFNLRSSLIYRLIVMVQCLLIIYCFNIFIGMPLTFSLEYLSTLVLPMLIVTNFPVSALIFNGLYKTKKYSVVE